MEPIRLLDGLVQKTAPGRSPDYTRAHVLYALVILRNNRMGRKQLSEELRLGEGTVRTLLGRLQDEGLVQVTRPGASLSSDGEKYHDKLSSLMQWASLPGTDATVDSVNWGVLVRGAADRIRYGVEQRDQALIHGASGASTFVYQGDKWGFPGLGDNIDEVFLERLSEFDPADGDVLIVGTGSDIYMATLGAFAAAIDLLD